MPLRVDCPHLAVDRRGDLMGTHPRHVTVDALYTGVCLLKGLIAKWLCLSSAWQPKGCLRLLRHNLARILIEGCPGRKDQNRKDMTVSDGHSAYPVTTEGRLPPARAPSSS